MRRLTVPFLLLAVSLLPGARAAKHLRHVTSPKNKQPEKCFQIRGRAILYRGDGVLAIWHVGTHHIFYPVGDKSWDLLCSYMDCKSPRKQPALFADMTVCPTEPFVKGAAQSAIVTKVTHYYVVPDWPPPGRK